MARSVAHLRFCFLSALFPVILLAVGGQTGIGDRPPPEIVREQFIPLPESPWFNDEGDIKRLREGEPIVGDLSYKQQKLIRFALTEVEDVGFPDVIIWLRTTNQNGIADLKCSPWSWARGEGSHFGQVYPWESNISRGLNAVFLPSVSKEYRAAVTNVSIVHEDREEEDVPAAAFVCVIRGLSKTGTEFQVDMDVTLGGLKLEENERSAVRDIANQCCGDDDLCPGWPDTSATEGAGGEEDTHDGLHVSTNLCHVPGNVCDLDGRLIKMNVRDYNLSCKFPTAALAAFKALQTLDTSGNQFTGAVDQIGAALASTASLTHITLSSCGLSGSLSGSNGLCDLVSNGIQTLNLRDNDIEGSIPDCLLAEGSKLLAMELSKNPITGNLPDILPPGSPLESIIISNTEISGTIPNSLVQAEFLYEVDLTNNDLTGPVPDNLETLPVLDYFNISGNSLETLPDRWSDSNAQISDSLSVVDISFNLLDGVFPVGLGRAKKLDHLDMSNNRLDGSLPGETELFPGLKYLNISFNGFSGAIPASLQDFGIFRLQFIPPDIGRLDARSNRLLGEVPSFFFTDSKSEESMRVVYLEGNNVTCPSERAALSIVDACLGLEEEEEGPSEDIEEMENAAKVNTGMTSTGDNGTAISEQEAEKAFEEAMENEREAEEKREKELEELEATLKGDGKVVETSERDGGDSSAANIAAALVSGVVGVFIFAMILGFIIYWRQRKNAVGHMRFIEEDVEMSQGL